VVTVTYVNKDGSLGSWCLEVVVTCVIGGGGGDSGGGAE